MFKLCVVGCGGIARIAHFPAIQKYIARHPDVRLVACSDIDEGKALAAKAQFNIPNAYTNTELMLAVERPDAVLCLVPESLVSTIACDIMRKGYPVLLEKPPGETMEQVRNIAELSRTKNVPHMVAFNRRFSPYLLPLKQKVTEQEIIAIDYTMERIDRTEDCFETTAIHAVDTVLYLAGCKARQVEIHYQETPHLGDKVANYVLYFTFVPTAAKGEETPRPFIATIRVYPNTTSATERITVYTKTEVLETALPAKGDVEEMGFYDELAYFVECIRSGTRPVHTAETCFQPVAVCELMKHRVTKYLF